MITLYEIVLNLFIVALSMLLLGAGIFIMVVIGMVLVDKLRERQKGDR
jgi:hypothetical protein